MKLNQLAAGIAVAALLPVAAAAQTTCEQRSTNRTMGTVAGAGIGAVLGGLVAGKGDRTTGAVVGGLGGGLIGNQLAKAKADCARAYGYYDNAGAWHASNVSASNAQGYYDREGQWVDGQPNGYYSSDGRWVRASTDARSAGYTDAHGHWIPASTQAYYDADGRYVAGAASGHYDARGRWVASPATGRYDARGRWIPGQPARVTDVQPGYYDQGRWIAGPTTGYYDTQGRFIRVDNTPQQPQRGNMPNDVSGRSAWLEQRIQRGLGDGTLTRMEGNQALRRLTAIDREARTLRTRNGNLRPRDEQLIMARLETLTADVRQMRRGPVRDY